ncbi:MAG: MarR family transcriptional regulator [Muribaculaceae bacterium]|nr:MarR family transcriptional regulator [Muribaculaceae bacterium]
MSNIPDYIITAINRINEFLPEKIKAMELQPTIKKKIPFGLSGAYDYYQTEIYNKPFIIAGVGDDDENMAPTVLARQKEVLLKQTGIIPVFVFNKIASYLFHRYTKSNIDIVVGNRQLFLPSIFLVVSREKPEQHKEPEKPPVLFQLAVLFHLEKENIDGITMQTLAEKLKTSYATVNRGIRWMKEKGFVTLSGGKEKQIQFNYQGKDLWEKALPYLETPVDFIVYTPELGISENGLVSEQNALAEYSLLNGGPYRIAVSKEEYKNLKKKDIYWDPFGEAGIEVWKYDPALLSGTGVVDKLSLYLLLKDYEDERVQIELENMINDIIW